MIRLDATMRELDRAAEAAWTPKTADVIPADVAVRYLRELPDTWRAAKGGAGQQLLASALFSRIEILGLREATVHLTEHAVRHGIAAALPEEVGISVSGRGERNSAVMSDAGQIVRFERANALQRRLLTG